MGLQTINDLTRWLNYFSGYNPSDQDVSNAPAKIYFGFLNKDGEWYIMEQQPTSFRYVAGSSGYVAAWAGRESLSYDYFDEIF